MIKLIVSDLDGTLLEDGTSRINPQVFDVILRLKEQGIYFMAASGRQAASIEAVFAPVKDRIFYVGDNGAYVGCYGRNLFLTEVDRQTALELIGEIKRLGLNVLVGGAEYVYVDSSDESYIRWLEDGYQFRMKRVSDVREVTEPIIKVSACDRNGIGERSKILVEKFGGRLKVTPSGKEWVDAMCIGVSKGNALHLVQESLSILPEETMVFGDQLNDIEMMKQAYYSFAVENAMPETKRAARFLTDSNVNDGVLKIMKLFLERERKS